MVDNTQNYWVFFFTFSIVRTTEKVQNSSNFVCVFEIYLTMVLENRLNVYVYTNK
jgi:hypothetical protein